jgi:hypothetical protein
MKINVRLFVLALLVLVATSQVFAQGRRGQFEIYAGAGIPLSPDEFKDYFKLGLSLNAQYVFFPAHQVGIPIFAGYERFTVDKTAISDLFSSMLVGQYVYDDFGNLYQITDASVDSKGSASVFRFGAGVRPYLTSPESSTQFFLFGNASYNLLKQKLEFTKASLTAEDEFGNTLQGEVSGSDLGDAATSESDENKFGIAVGAGIEIPAGSSLNLIFQGLYNMIFTEEKSSSFIGVTAGLVF